MVQKEEKPILIKVNVCENCLKAINEIDFFR